MHRAGRVGSSSAIMTRAVIRKSITSQGNHSKNSELATDSPSLEIIPVYHYMASK